jgi:hypothetical protein
MPVIYQQYLMALGIKEFSIELIGTNNGVKTCNVTYNYNIPSGYESKFSQTTSNQIFAKNASGVVGETATYTVDDTSYLLSSEKTKEMLDNKFIFQGWNTKADGSGTTYLDGDAYFFYNDETLYARWTKSEG